MSIAPFSSRFRASSINVEGADQYVRTGGSGPAVLLLHGFGDTGDMWQPLAELLVADHTVIVPDLRGMGLDHGRTATTGHRRHHQVHRGQMRCTYGL